MTIRSRRSSEEDERYEASRQAVHQVMSWIDRTRYAMRTTTSALVKRCRSILLPQRLGLALDISARCNLRCRMCSFAEQYEDKGLMSLHTFRRLLDVFSKAGWVSFSCNAEPLLNKNLLEMLKIAKEASANRIAVSFTTNGTLLNEKLSRALIEHNLNAIEISMDGATMQTFESIRLGAKFEVVVENVKRLVSLKRRLNRSNPQVLLRFTLSKDNVHELSAFIDLARQLEIDHVAVNGLEPYTKERAEKVLYGPRGHQATAALFEEIKVKASAFGIRLDLPSLVPHPIQHCTLALNSCVVLWDGTVVPCAPLSYKRRFYYFDELVEHPRVVFGNIKESPLIEIWNSHAFRDFRENLRVGKIYDFCQTCLMMARVLCPL